MIPPGIVTCKQIIKVIYYVSKTMFIDTVSLCDWSLFNRMYYISNITCFFFILHASFSCRTEDLFKMPLQYMFCTANLVSFNDYLCLCCNESFTFDILRLVCLHDFDFCPCARVYESTAVSKIQFYRYDK